jgi:hypothetical protein
MAASGNRLGTIWRVRNWQKREKSVPTCSHPPKLAQPQVFQGVVSPSKYIEMLLPVVYMPTSSYRSQTGYNYSKEGREYEYQLYF